MSAFTNCCIESAQVFIPLMRFLQWHLVSRNFFIRLRFILVNLFFLSLLVWWCPLPIFQSTCNFPFLKAFWFFDLVVLFFLLFIIMSIVHFSMPNSIPIPWLYILIVCIRVPNFFIFFKQLDVVHIYKVINLFL